MRSRSQWPSGLRRGSSAVRLLGLRVRIPLGAWVYVSCECCVLSCSSLCGWPIPRPEKSYRLWYVIVCDLETSSTRRPWLALGCCARNKRKCEGPSVPNDWMHQNRSIQISVSRIQTSPRYGFRPSLLDVTRCRLVVVSCLPACQERQSKNSCCTA